MTTKTGAYPTVFTEPSEREIAATRVFDAPLKLVWDAHALPEHLKHWLLGPEGWTLPVCDMDLRPGGAWHYVWRNAEGEELEMRGEYREVVPMKRVVNTENWGGDWPETFNTLTFAEEGGRTTITSTVLYPSKEAREAALSTGMKEGWAESYDRLEEYLRRMR